MEIEKQYELKTTANTGFALVGGQCELETFEQLINVGAGRQFWVLNAHQRKARKRYAAFMKTLYYTILLFALIISSCTSYKPVETLSYDNEPAKTISEFLRWYKDNNEKLNSIQLIKNPLPDDTQVHIILLTSTALKSTFWP